jgi:hypothetical protein
MEDMPVPKKDEEEEGMACSGGEEEESGLVSKSGLLPHHRFFPTLSSSSSSSSSASSLSSLSSSSSLSSASSASYSVRMQVEILLLLMLPVFLTTFSSVFYLPAYNDIAQSLNTSDTIISLSVSLTTLFAGVTPLIFGPICDTMGRRIPILIASPIGCVGGLIAGFAHENSVSLLLIGRALLGVGLGASQGVSHCHPPTSYFIIFHPSP